MKLLIPILFIFIAGACLAQPYEPIILLDVTGELGEALGSSKLYALGDQNGDGFDDFLTGGNHPVDGGMLKIFFGSNQQNADYIMFAHVDTSEYEYWWGGGDFSFPLPDVDGNGHRDLFVELIQYNHGNWIYFPTVFYGGPASFDTIPDWIGEGSEMRFTTNVGDYDGDGRDDVTRRPLNPDYFAFYRSDDPMPSTPTWTMERDIGNNQYGHNHTGFGDFNGDGFSDFGFSYSTEEYSSNLDLFLGSPEADSLPGYIYQWGSIPQEFERRFHFVGDVNGDGYDDLISEYISWWTGLRKYLYYGGDPFDFEVDHVFYHENIPWKHIGLGDINADGYDDFAIYATPDDIGTVGFEIYLGGDPPTLEPVWTLLSPFEGMNMPYRIGPAGDFNGDGIDDWMFSCYEGGEGRGRIIVIAGDRNFGLPAQESPDFSPFSFILHPCYPNPFNSTVTIPFTIPGSRMQRVAFTIYNTLGQTVYSFPTQTYTSGNHSLHWNGETNTGTPTTGGMNFLITSTATSKQTSKLIYVP